MRLARMLFGGVLLTLTSAAGMAFEDAPLQPVLPELITTTDHEFAIPYAVEDLAQGPDRPAQVQLFVSADRGQSWMLHAMARPEAGSFTFRAPYDGEFWFLLRSVDAQGKVWPEGAPHAEMRVAVMSPVEPATLPGKEPRVGQEEPPTTQQQSTVPHSLLPAGPPGVVAGFPVDRLPPGTQPRMVNSHAFEIDYDVDTAGPSAAGRVELFWTGDGGRTWNRYDTDDDCRSPMLVQVERDGLYGFWLTIDGIGGLRGETPREGDVPQAWVGVDTMPPVARLTTAEPAGEQGASLSIRWEATDALLAPAPISLAYSTRASGPWTEIATGLTNNGQHTFQPPHQLPAQVYLRLQARDEAGNVQVFDTSEAVIVSQPTTVSRGARSAGDWARGPRWYQVLR